MIILELHRSGSDLEVTAKNIRTDEVVLKTTWFVDCFAELNERYDNIIESLQQTLFIMKQVIRVITTNDRELYKQLKEVSGLHLYIHQY